MAGSITAPSFAKSRPSFPPPTIRGYGIAVIAVFGSWVLRLLLERAFNGANSFIVYIPGVLITGWYAGFRPALLATLGSTLVASYYLPPVGLLAVSNTGDAVNLSFFTLLCMVVGRITSNQREAKERAARSLDVAEERHRQLQVEIQERRRVEDILRRQAHALQAHTELMELAHDTIIVRTVDGHITFWNAAAEQMYGWGGDEVQGKNVHHLLRSEFQTTLHEINVTLFRVGNWEGEVTHTCRDGKRVTVISRWAVQRGVDDKPIAVIQIDRDVSQQLRAELEIRRLNADLQLRLAELQTLFDTIPIGIAVTQDASCSKIRRNRALSRMLLAPSESNLDPDSASAPPFRVFQDGRELKHTEFPMHVAAAARREIREWEGDVVRADGKVVHLLAYASPLFDGSGSVRGCIGTYVDITERKRTEEELRQKRDEIEALNQRLRRAMAETHHRVKNNLQVISALVDLQAMDHSEVVPVGEITRLGHHIRCLAAVHDLLTFEAKSDSEVNYLSARAALDKLMPMVEAMAQGRTIVYGADDARLPVRNGTALTILVNELVSNSLKHGAGEISIQFRVLPDDPGEQTRVGIRGITGVAELEVCDSGPGFPPDFDPILAAHTGLELIENLSRWDLSGSATYSNRPQGGARVVVKFPVGSTTEEFG